MENPPPSQPIAAGPAAPKAPETPPLWLGGTIKGTRDSVIAQIGNSGLSSVKKASLFEDIQNVPAEIQLLRLDYHAAPYNAGVNVTYTITEL